MKEPANYLGISLGVRRLGLAVGMNQELIDWQVKVFDETYSKKKAKKIWRAIERTIQRYDIKVIGMNLPLNKSRTDGIRYCLKYITQKALEKDIVLYFYDIDTIEAHFLKTEVKNKLALAAVLSEKYPELKREFFKISTCQYHLKVFEAVAALELVILEFQ